MNPLFTIGHSSHTAEAFLELLRQHTIEVVADVRSRPYSGRFPWFSREPLQAALKETGIRYVFLGEELGARRSEKDCYIENRADYERIARSPAFARGLERLRTGLESYRIALLCAEKDPLDCHRTILVARHAAAFAEVFHILADGRLETQAELEQRLMERTGQQPDLLRPMPLALDDAYRIRGQEIAYQLAEPNVPVVRDEE